MKRLILALMLMAVCLIAQAEDVIVLVSGATVKARVIEVGVSEITYRRADNPDGPVYKIAKSDVRCIVYPNGTADLFSESQAPVVADSSSVTTTTTTSVTTLLPSDKVLSEGDGYERLWTRVMVGYNSVLGDAGNDTCSYSGISAHYLVDWRLTRDYPLYVETGVSAAFYTKTKTVRTISSVMSADAEGNLTFRTKRVVLRSSYLWAGIPVNLTYRTMLPGTKLEAIPVAGVLPHWYIVGRIDDRVPTGKELAGIKLYDGVKQYDCFDRNDMKALCQNCGLDPLKYNRFQLSWNLGLSLRYKHYLVSYLFQKDWTRLDKIYGDNNKLCHHHVCVGYAF